MSGNNKVMQRARSTQAVVDEAAQWVIRMAASEVSLADKCEFVAWLKRSPVNLGEYLRVERTWADFSEMKPARRIDIDALLASAPDNVVEFGRAAEPSAGVADRKPRTRRVAMAVAAAATFLLVGVFWFQTQFAHRYSTGIGEQRTLKLDDGSTVVLNTNTAVRVAFRDQLREIHLLAGEALFDVAKDASRPFRVISEKAVAQAVGTSFVVRQRDRQTVVTVIEGQVAVTHATSLGIVAPDETFSQAVHVWAGERAAIAEESIDTSAIENPAAAIAWRSGNLVFDGESLANVVAEFNRYNKVQLVLKDPSLAQQRLSGVFDAGQPLGLVRFLEHSRKVEPTQQVGAEIFLSPRR